MLLSDTQICRVLRHSCVVEHSIQVAQTESLQCDQFHHALIARAKCLYFHHVQRNSVADQERLEALVHQLRELLNSATHLLKWCDQEELVHCFFNDWSSICVDILNVECMTSIGHMLSKLDRVFLGCNMDIVIYAIIYLGHFERESDTTGFYYQLGTIDVKNLVLPGDWLARECQLHGTEER